jgi:glutamate/aspartate transport system substrate-binding protein
VKKKLNKPDLQVKLIPITSQNRIPLLQNGTFDFECGSTTNNVERQKQAAFSDTIFVVGTRLLAKKGGDVKDFADLKGKAVVVTSGTTSEVLLHKLNEEQKWICASSARKTMVTLSVLWKAVVPLPL